MIIQRKLFARRDYEGLGEEAKERLKEDRKRIADRLRKKRSIISEIDPSKSTPPFGLRIKDVGDVDEIMKMNTKEDYLRSGVRKNTYDDAISSAKNSAKHAREELLKELEREELLKELGETIREGSIPTTGPKEAAKNSAKGQVKAAAPSFFKRNKKALLIGGGVAALGGAGIYGYKKLKKNKE